MQRNRAAEGITTWSMSELGQNSELMMDSGVSYAVIHGVAADQDTIHNWTELKKTGCRKYVHISPYPNLPEEPATLFSRWTGSEWNWVGLTRRKVDSQPVLTYSRIEVVLLTRFCFTKVVTSVMYIVSRSKCQSLGLRTLNTCRGTSSLIFHQVWGNFCKMIFRMPRLMLRSKILPSNPVTKLLGPQMPLPEISVQTVWLDSMLRTHYYPHLKMGIFTTILISILCLKIKYLDIMLTLTCLNIDEKAIIFKLSTQHCEGRVLLQSSIAAICRMRGQCPCLVSLEEQPDAGVNLLQPYLLA